MNSVADDFELNLFFLEGSRGKLFATFRYPAAQQPCIGAVLCVMPLAEEMNRCRRLVALQSCALASAGFAVLCVDPYGSGDSEGEFADVSWQIWVNDLRVAQQWLETKTGHRADIWAIRHGALLAAAAFKELPSRRVVLWQPVVSGAAALAEMLRVSVASSMLNAKDKPTTVDALKAALLGGEAVEVGGYLITPELARELDKAHLDPWPFADSNVEWLEIVPEGSAATSPQQSSAAEALRGPGVKMRSHSVAGRRFWSSPDVFECDQLMSKTLQLLSDRAMPA